MIIWLASYPKSGNTWVRLFLDNLFSKKKKFDINDNRIIEQFPLRKHFQDLTKNINDQDEFAKNCIFAQEKINLDGKIKFFKTHNAFWNWKNGTYHFTNENNTLGTIHIVRDPRNVITSILNYYHRKDYAHALEFMKENKILGGSSEEIGLPTIVGSWGNHFKSWKKLKKNYLLIKYENLIKNPLDEFSKITRFLELNANYKFEIEDIKDSINKCSFKNLSEQEDLHGFIDNSVKNKQTNTKFFNLGPKNNWTNLLDDKIRLEIEEVFKNEMKEIGYL